MVNLNIPSNTVCSLSQGVQNFFHQQHRLKRIMYQVLGLNLPARAKFCPQVICPSECLDTGLGPCRAMHSEIPARCSGKARIGAKTPAWWPETFPQLEPVGFKTPIPDCGLYLMKKKIIRQHLSWPFTSRSLRADLVQVSRSAKASLKIRTGHHLL